MEVGSGFTAKDDECADKPEQLQYATSPWCGLPDVARHVTRRNRTISVYRFRRRALTLCPQLCMGIQPGARFPTRSADALTTTLYGHFTQAIYRNRPI
jgi:hypothetical protein